MIESLKLKLAGAWRSWTIWFNSLAAAVMAGLPIAADYFPQLQPYLDDHAFKALGLIVVGGNFLLRFKTSQDLAAK